MDNFLHDTTPEVIAAKQKFGIVGHSAALTAAVSRALQVGPIDLSVLVTGESGVGKEFFPKLIHDNSHRKHSRYIAVNCGAIPEGTIDSELFGHEKGAFTGAVASRKGYFEEADGGTIFLDEVGELPLTTQARLLRVLESGEFIKVGSSKVEKCNVRIVAATNVDMQEAVAKGRFREDLFYRLSTVQIHVPPLRERGDDIVILAEKFLRDFAERYRTPRAVLSDDARAALFAARWPGNVRQLKNVMDQLALFSAGNAITAEDVEAYLPPVLLTPATLGRDPINESHSDSDYAREREMLFGMILGLRREIEQLKAQLAEHRPEPVSQIEDPKPVTGLVKYEPVARSLAETEKEMISRTLRRNLGQRKQTARELNISERTLYRKIKEYGIE